MRTRSPLAKTSPPGPKRTGRPRDPAVDEAILRAAAELLGESGYAKLTIDGVAQRAGVTRKSIYRRWSDKLQLVTDLLQQVSEGSPRPNTGALRTDLLGIYQTNSKSLETAGGPIIPGLVAESLYDSELASILEAYFSRRRADALKILERAVERGEILPINDPGVFFDLVSGFFWYRRLLRHRDIRQDQADQFVDILINGLPKKVT
jgi:AcrR family transcriptional regulator